MTFEELGKALKAGKAVATKENNAYFKLVDGKIKAFDKSNGKYIANLYCFNFLVEKVLNDKSGFEIYNKPILDEAEKRYLSGVIRPFRKDYEITIRQEDVGDGLKYICIYLKKISSGRCEYIALPFFEAGEMYKGMNTNEKYTLKELGL